MEEIYRGSLKLGKSEKKGRRIKQGNSSPPASHIPCSSIDGRKRINTISCGRNGKEKIEVKLYGALPHRKPWTPFSLVKMASPLGGPDTCGRTTSAELPPEVAQSQFGPRVHEAIGYLTSVHRIGVCVQSVILALPARLLCLRQAMASAAHQELLSNPSAERIGGK